MSALSDIKNRLHIYYSDPHKDAELQSYIAEAKSYMINAGCSPSFFADGAETPEALGAIALYVKMVENSDAAQMRNHPVLISLISQMRNTKIED